VLEECESLPVAVAVAVAGAVLGSLAVGERKLLPCPFSKFAPGIVAAADRASDSFTLWRDTLASGAELVWRIKSTVNVVLSCPVLSRPGRWPTGRSQARWPDGPDPRPAYRTTA
jgi:hypothetical protein